MPYIGIQATDGALRHYLQLRKVSPCEYRFMKLSVKLLSIAVNSALFTDRCHPVAQASLIASFASSTLFVCVKSSNSVSTSLLHQLLCDFTYDSILPRTVSKSQPSKTFTPWTTHPACCLLRVVAASVATMMEVAVIAQIAVESFIFVRTCRSWEGWGSEESIAELLLRVGKYL